MDSEKDTGEPTTNEKVTSGTYTQVPNVLFDSCDLPESAQILYLRLYRKVAYKDCRFIGSLRKLSSLVRMSKSTVDRMSKKLRDAGLLTIHYLEGDEIAREVMVITVLKAELWQLNKHHYEVEEVQPWIVMPEVCPNLGQHDSNLGQHNVNLGHDDSNLGRGVPDASTNRETTKDNTVNTSNTREESSSKSELPQKGVSPSPLTGEMKNYIQSLEEKIAQLEASLSEKHSNQTSVDTQEEQEAAPEQPNRQDSKQAVEETPDARMQEWIKTFKKNFITIAREMFNSKHLTITNVKKETIPVLIAMLTERAEEEGFTGITLEEQREVFDSFWDEREKDKSYWWRDPTRLTFNAYVSGYSTRLAGIDYQQSNQQSNPKRRLKAATPGSQYIVDELQARGEEAFQAWLASPEGQACTREAEEREQQETIEVTATSVSGMRNFTFDPEPVPTFERNRERPKLHIKKPSRSEITV